MTPTPHRSVTYVLSGPFDFTPNATNTFYASLGSAAFTPREGAFSTLEPAPGESALFFSERGLSGGVYGENGAW